MKAVSECSYCYLKQAHTSISLVFKDQEMILASRKRLLPLMKSFSLEKTPCDYSTLVLKEVNRLLSVYDPFSEGKKLCNTMALEWEGYLRRLIHSSREPLRTAIKLSVLGEINRFLVHNSSLKSAFDMVLYDVLGKAAGIHCMPFLEEEDAFSKVKSKHLKRNNY